jgi:hypothetical protein
MMCSYSQYLEALMLVFVVYVMYECHLSEESPHLLPSLDEDRLKAICAACLARNPKEGTPY